MPIFTYECQKCQVMEDKFFKPEERPTILYEKCCICGSDGIECKKVLTKTTGYNLINKEFLKYTTKID